MSRPRRFTEKEFLFDSLGSRAPNSERKYHIRRLVDLLQLCIHKHDWKRARKAWGILARCPEFDWKPLWQTGVLLTSSSSDGEVAGHDDPRRLEFLRVMMVRTTEDRVPILRELILWLIKAGRQREALDELDLYLPSFPYNDVPSLHIYAGLLCIFLTCPSASQFENITLNMNYLHKAKSHLRRAIELDSENPVPLELLTKLETLSTNNDMEGNGSEGLILEANDSHRPAKKQR